MKSGWFYGILFGLAACGSPEVGKKLDPKTASDRTDTASTDRAALVRALKDLGRHFGPGRPEPISFALDLPRPDSLFNVDSEDSSFQKDLEASGHTLTPSFFTQHFSELSQQLRLSELRKLFSVLPLDSLAFHDELEWKDIKKGQPCYPFYRIRLDGIRVELSVGTNSNPDYTDPSDEDEAGDACEFAVIYLFNWEKGRLRFQRQLAAG